MAARLPDRGIVGEILAHYLDAVLQPERREPVKMAMSE
jgi:hypothetical protein